jgi:pimeloyl-ACP methyl ester carboxylesterase
MMRRQARVNQHSLQQKSTDGGGMRRVFLLVAVLATIQLAEARTEVGDLSGAQFRVDVPDNWNRGLVIYCHGYSTDPVTFDGKKPLEENLAVFTAAGYAVAQSSYSTTGWAIEQAIPEIESLRKYFIERFGMPQETFVSGESMGGLLTTIMIEKFPQSYDAGLALCGALGPTPVLMQHAFDMRVVFDYFFPRVLPPPDKVPTDFKTSDALTKHIVALLKRKPLAAATLRHMAGIRKNEDLADGVAFITYILKDLQQRAGGNPFDNRQTIYTGSDDDNALNDGVARYSASPAALEYLENFYTPSGKLTRPILAVHTTYDPLVSPNFPNRYALLTREAGNGNMFVQQYVKNEGHCNFTSKEIERAFAELRDWKMSGNPPAPGWLKVQEAKKK